MFDSWQWHVLLMLASRIGHDESCGLTFLTSLYAALKSGHTAAEALVPQVVCQNTSKQDRLTISGSD